MSEPVPSNVPAQRSAFVAAAERLKPIVEANRAALSVGPDLPAEVANALIQAGLAQLWLPRSLGGPEVDPLECFHVMEALAKLDGAVAWCASISSGGSRFAGMISSNAMRRILPAGNTFAFCGSGHPTGSITQTDSGWSVSGRWSWMSFCRYSDAVGVLCMEHENGAPRFTPEGYPILRGAILPAAKVQISSNWDGAGLRSSGSHDVSCTDVTVSNDETLPMDTPERQPGPLYTLPMATAAAITTMGIPLGLASAAIDAFIALASTKVPFTSSVPLREQPNIQTEVAWAKTRLLAARAFATETITSLWQSVSSGQPASVEQQALIRMACWNAGEAGKEIVGRMFAAAGSTAVLEKEGFAAQLRDVYAATQHINFANRLMATPGRILLGLDPETPMI